MKKVNPQRKLNLSWKIFFFVPQRVCPEKSRKEGRFRRHADLFQLRDSSVFFHRNVPTAQSCSPFISKLLGKRRKTLCCGGVPVSRSVVRQERHGGFSYITLRC